MHVNKLAQQKGFPAAFVLCLVIILPSLAWLFIDKAPFGGDQSQYASATLELYRSWTLTPWLWAKAMISAVGFKAPGIAWLGQWFVPLGSLLGSIDTALLLSIVATQAITLLLVFRALWILSGGDVPVSLAGCLLMAAAPLFQYLSFQYLVEPLQLLAVAWFLLIMSHAPRWNRAFTLAQLVAVTSVAMLAKTSSPLYWIGPALVILGYVLGIGATRLPWAWGRPATVFAWIVATPLSFGTACWYYRNISPVLNHVRMSSSGPIAAVWGKEDTFFNSLVYWVDTTARLFFLTPSLVLAVILVISGIAGYLLRPDLRKSHFTLCCVVSILQIALVLVSFSFASNRSPRYLLALLPYFALIVGWSISHIPRRTVTVLATGILASIWVIASGHSLQLFDVGLRAFGPVPRINRDVGQSAVIHEIVTRTCAETSQPPYYNVIAIDPSLKGDWLAPEPVNYAVTRDHLFSQNAAPCSYGYTGGGFFGSDASNSWLDILEKKPRYIVTVDPSIYPPSEKTYNQALSRQNFPILIERLRMSHDFDLVARLSSDPGILIFRESGHQSTSVVSTQSGKLSVNLEETRRLFELLSERDPGDVYGLVEMRDTGILIHPGATTPTRASFDIGGKYVDATLVAFIASLPPEAFAVKNAGTVGVEFFMDGKSTGRETIDRLTSYERTFNLKGVKTLAVTVDNSDGSPWWDWLFIAIK